MTVRDGFLRVLGKGRKQREVPIGVNARKMLHDYIRIAHTTEIGENHVFLGYRHEPLTVSALDQMLHRLKQRANITGIRVSAHSFRHTFAMNFLAQGGDVYVLSRLMGHESVQVTEVYLRSLRAEQARKSSKSVLDNL